jgi:hypothetical protein
MHYEVRMKSGKKEVIEAEAPLMSTNEDGVEFCPNPDVKSWKELPTSGDQKLVTR